MPHSSYPLINQKLAGATPLSSRVTLLFCSVANSADLWEQDRLAMQEIIPMLETLAAQTIKRQGGSVFNRHDDDTWAVFQTPQQALLAAVEIQQALQHVAWNELGPLQFAMALATASAGENQVDLFGPQAQRTARLLAAGHGGQILLTQDCARLLETSLPEGVTLRDLGEHRLRDLSKPERVFQFSAPTLADNFPQLDTLDKYPNNLPVQPTPLIAREQELGYLALLLQQPNVRLLTLTGPGGAGKTRLGLQVAANVLDRFPDGAFFVPLATITEPNLVVNAIAEALNIVETRGRSLHENVLGYLRERNLLLALDNFEQVMGAARLVDDLLAAAPQIKAVVTSRIPLGLEGEHEFNVPRLNVPDSADLPALDSLLRYPSLALFASRARALRPGFQLNEANAAAIAAICARLEGLPLAIELAAARIDTMAPYEILQRLDHPLTLLVGGAADLPPRQQTLRGAISWSYDLLDPDEQALFRQLAVFVGGASREAIAAIAQPDAAPNNAETAADVVENIDRTLESLTSKNLVRREEDEAGADRFVMLETIREYALEKLVDSGEANELRRRHVGYFLRLAREAAPQIAGHEQVAWLERLEQEHDNLRAALGWALRNNETDLAAQLSAGLLTFWLTHCHFAEGLRWVKAVLLALGSARDIRMLSALNGAGILARGGGDLAQAEAFLLQALELSKELASEAGTASALYILTTVALDRGDYAQAREFGSACYALFQQLGDKFNTANALRYLGWAVAGLDDFSGARAYYGAALTMYEELGDKMGIASVLNNLGELARAEQDFATAADLYNRALVMHRELGNEWGVAIALHNLGFVAINRDQPRQAAGLFIRSLKISESLGNKQHAAACLAALAGLAVREGAMRLAVQLCGLNVQVLAAVGAMMTPVDEAERNATIEATRAFFSAEEWDAAWAEGQRLTIQQADEAITNLLLEQN